MSKHHGTEVLEGFPGIGRSDIERINNLSRKLDPQYVEAMRIALGEIAGGWRVLDRTHLRPLVNRSKRGIGVLEVGWSSGEHNVLSSYELGLGGPYPLELVLGAWRREKIAASSLLVTLPGERFPILNVAKQRVAEWDGCEPYGHIWVSERRYTPDFFGNLPKIEGVVEKVQALKQILQ